ncbi:MAG: radical SAM protein [Desulfobacteraceae bacterium]
MILIFPPVSKPCEPPASVAQLSGALRAHRIGHEVVDANLEALLWLFHSTADMKTDSSWTKRALSNLDTNLAALKTMELYGNPDRYRQKIFDLNRALSTRVQSDRFRVTLSGYTDTDLSPVRSEDLLKSAVNFRENPFYGYFEACLRPRIEQSDPAWIGVSLCYMTQALSAFALAGWVKENFPGKKIVMGGGLVTSWLRMPDFRNPFNGLIDMMVQGEGEASLLNIAGSDVPGAERCTPDYGFADFASYQAPGRILPYSASRGCYWRKCRFCPERAEKSVYRPVDSQVVVKDLEELYEKYNPDCIHFVDNAMSPALMRRLALEQPRFNWYGFARIGKELEEPEYLKALKRSGCVMLKLGLESGDQGVLDAMEKGTDLDVASRVLTRIKDAGIKAFVYLLFGTPGENEAAAERTLAYTARHADRIDFLNLAVFNMPRFSLDAEKYSVSEFSKGDLSLYYNFEHPAGWGRKEVRAFLDKRFKREPSIAGILRKNPPCFTSNHAPFFM